MLIENLAHGFAAALSPENLLAGIIGVLVGTAVGVLPGLGPAVAIAILLPLTFGLDPVAALILFGGIYYGAMFGGSITSILIATPGDASAAITMIDGHPMARNGKAGQALTASIIGSFFGGTLASFLLMLTAMSFAAVSLLFGPPEYFALMLMALIMVVTMTGGSVPRGSLALCLGLWLSTIGIDLQTGQQRFTFGLAELHGGIDARLGAIGLFALGEALWLITAGPSPDAQHIRPNRIWLKFNEWRRCFLPWLRGSVIGFLTGVLPGTGAVLATILSYATERRLARNPAEFGKGAIEGVAGPESANNAAAGGSLVPLLALGIPGSGTTAVMLVAFQMYGLQPGPSLLENNAALVWALIASMYVANVLLVLLNLPLIGLWVQLLKVPQSLLAGIIVIFASVGAYSAQGSFGDLLIVWILGIGAFLLRRFEFPITPVLLGLILGPMLEQELRRSLTMSSGDLSIFVTRPISLVALVLTFGSVVFAARRYIRRRPA